MGNSNSAERKRENDRIRYNNAVELYRQRVRNYNYAYHGNYSDYLIDIQAQFQLDCLPEWVKYGSNYVER